MSPAPPRPPLAGMVPGDLSVRGNLTVAVATRAIAHARPAIESCVRAEYERSNGPAPPALRWALLVDSRGPQRMLAPQGASRSSLRDCLLPALQQGARLRTRTGIAIVDHTVRLVFEEPGAP